MIIDISTFLFLVTVFSIITSLFTEAFKKVLGDRVAPNLIVGLIASFIALAGGYISYTLLDISITETKNIIVLVLFIPTNWLCAMVGYDKVMQTIAQILNKEK